MTNIVPFQTNAELYRASTDAAGLCGEIVKRTAMEIQGRKYVKVEGWQAIAVAHGCVGSACDVQVTPEGVRAIGQVKRMSDGMVIAEGEGFVGCDEPTWYGGETLVWDKQIRDRVKKMLPKRADYAIRAMAQTRAISRACRSAFAHVVVLIDSNLSTTPAEEVPEGGWDDAPMPARTPEEPKKAAAGLTTPETQRGRPAARQAAPPPKRTVDRSGAQVPTPSGDDPKDWMKWQRAVGLKIERAGSEGEIKEISAAHAAGVARSNEILEGSATAFAELITARIDELSPKAA